MLQKKKWPLNQGTVRHARVRNHTAFISKNGASRQMLLRAAPEA
ncbi:hypothetical protein A2U01_0092611, partial [Trifolium medium]|nr:hypothetical protein [Trifolium medium]